MCILMCVCVCVCLLVCVYVSVCLCTVAVVRVIIFRPINVRRKLTLIAKVKKKILNCFSWLRILGESYV